MKIIRVKNKNLKEAQFKWVVEKAKGLLEKVRNIFRNPSDRETATESMKGQLEDEQLEKMLVSEDEAGFSPESTNVTEPASDEDQLKQQRIESLVNQNKNLKIKILYKTLLYGTILERTIVTPSPKQQIRYAYTTGNRILIAWCEEWNDYRAFALQNIMEILEINKLG